MGQFFTFLLNQCSSNHWTMRSTALPREGSGRLLRSSESSKASVPAGSLAAEAAFPGLGCHHLGSVAADSFSLLFPPLHYLCALLASPHSWLLLTHGLFLPPYLLGVSLGDFPFPSREDLIGQSAAPPLGATIMVMAFLQRAGHSTRTRAR